jgi:hypothetical protein
MTRRRLPLLLALVLGVTALLAVVGLVAHGRPLSSGGGGGAGPTITFWNYAFTSLLALELLAAIGAIWMFWELRPDVGRRKSSPAGTLRALIILIAVMALLFFGGRYFFNRHNQSTTKPPSRLEQPNPGAPGGSPAKHKNQQIALQWPELVVVLVLVAAVGAVYVVRRKQLGDTPRRRRRLFTAPETVAAALDESLDDLRGDPDLRQAIVAAYARMERALATVGMPRDPAEAPLEYLERVLLSLDTSAGAVRRLTDLFEWARFSHHEPDPPMRDEAIDALVAVRDELRAREPVATW